MQARRRRHRGASVRRVDQHPAGRRLRPGPVGVAAARRAGPPRRWSAASTRAGTCTPASCRPATSPTSRSTGEGFPRAAAPARGLRRQAPGRGSSTSRPPPAPWPATCIAATPAAPSRSRAGRQRPTSTPTSSRRWPAPSPTPRPSRPTSDRPRSRTMTSTYYAPHGGHPAADRAAHRPGDVHRGLRGDPARHDARHRHQPAAVLGRHPALGDRPAALGLRRDLLPVHRRGRPRRRQRQARARSAGRGRASSSSRARCS